MWFRNVLHLHTYGCLLRKWWQPHHLRHMKCTTQSMRNVFQRVVLHWQGESEQHFPSFSWLISFIAVYIIFLKKKKNVIVTAGGNKVKCSFTSKEGGGLKGSLPSISILKCGMCSHRYVSPECPHRCTEPFLWIVTVAEPELGAGVSTPKFTKRYSFDICKNRSVIP